MGNVEEQEKDCDPCNSYIVKRNFFNGFLWILMVSNIDNDFAFLQEFYYYLSVFHSFSVKRKQQVYTPQLNHISMKPSSFPLLSQRDSIDPNTFCNETSVKDCEKDFCSCTHVLQVKLKSVVEVILVDEGNLNNI